MPPLAPLQPWSWPTRPWSRLHLDFAGAFLGKIFLVLIDAHSKWIEVFITNSSTSSVVLEELKSTFARFGLPELIVTDNGACFKSEDFESFLEQNGIKHLTSAPYHPASNGLAERAVQILKRGLKKVVSGTLRSRVDTVLCSYRIAPQTTTGVSPSELLLGKRLRTRLDLLTPSIVGRVENKQMQQKYTHDRAAKARHFSMGDMVYVRDFGQGEKRWLRGLIKKRTGPVSFTVQMEEGNLRHCHQDQLRHRFSPPQQFQKQLEEDIIFPNSPSTRTVETIENTENETDPGTRQAIVQEVPLERETMRVGTRARKPESVFSLSVV